MRVLLVEDDTMIGEAIQGALKDASYATDWVKNGQTALTTLACQHYDVVLLDLGLPGKDGLEVLASIRAKDNPVPLLIITARDGLDDRLRGLDGGADDYVLKPFEMAELLARMRAVLRRKGGLAVPVLSNGALSLDPATHEVVAHGAAPLQLSNREFSLLQALLVRPGAILSRSDLEDRIYGWGEEVESNAVEFLIHALRRKLGSDAIKNVRGGMDGFKKRLNASIQLKLSLTLSLVILVVAVVAGIFSFMAAFDEAHELQDDTLRQVAALFNRQHLPTVRAGDNKKAQDGDEESRIVVQRLADGAKATGQLDTGALLPIPATLTDGMHTLDLAGEPFHVLVKTTALGERIAVAQETGVRDEIARDSALRTLMPFLILVPILLLIVANLVRKMFRPIATLSTKSISDQNKRCTR